MLTRTRNAAATVALLATALSTPMAPGTETASAAPNSYPVVSEGNRGVDVKAVQYLLAEHNEFIPKTGVFDSATVKAVKNFQKAKGLAADGIVGSKTWAALTPTISAGSPGYAGDGVRALQALLEKKTTYDVTVTGNFDAKTTAALRNFQKHAGLTADGVAGEATWTRLAGHFATPWWKYLCNQNPDNNPKADWGTGSTIGQIEGAAKSFSGKGYGRVPIGDISNEHGGDIGGHASHETGKDVDVWPIRKDKAQCWGKRITYKSPEYSRTATRDLVNAIKANAKGQVVLIFFNDPQLVKEGLTKPYANHDNHLHIRYR